jgi:hypothetical protein
MILLEVFPHVPSIIEFIFLITGSGSNHLSNLIIAHSNDIINIGMHSNPLNRLQKGGNMLSLLPLININLPKLNRTIHTGGNQRCTIPTPGNINYILAMPKKLTIRAPFAHFLRITNRLEILLKTIDVNVIAVGGKRQESAVGRVLYAVYVCYHLGKPVFALGHQVQARDVQLPDLYAT